MTSLLKGKLREGGAEIMASVLLDMATVAVVSFQGGGYRSWILDPQELGFSDLAKKTTE